MRKVTLAFPDSGRLADFLLRFTVAHAEVKASENALTAELSDWKICTAQAEYGAVIIRTFITLPTAFL